jgi:hydroxyethylthiazole kinase-like uncharacterized protein yjeF
MQELRIISTDEMRAMDAAAPRFGVSGLTLMENAGQAVVEIIRARFSARPTAVLCGPGGNGGDGYVVARRLRDAGWPVWVEADAPPNGGDAFAMAKRWEGQTYPLGRGASTPALIVDALFGAGLTRPLEGEARAAALEYAESTDRVVAVDLPSGLAGDTAAPLGATHFAAGLTVAFAAKKPAHVLPPAAQFCGEVVVADIGMPHQAWPSEGRLWVNDPLLWAHLLPWPQPHSHKHARGRVAVWMSGSESGPSRLLGAPRLTGRAALRMGVGWVEWLSDVDCSAMLVSEPAALMLRVTVDQRALAEAAGQATCIVVGPGLGRTEQTKTVAVTLTRFAERAVIDADALSAFASDPDQLLRHCRAQNVLTPHAGEFARLFPGEAVDATNKIAATRSAAQRAGCVVLHKGADTVIAAPDGRAVVNGHASPWLAVAGTGDVLAGMIAALAGQGMPSFEAAAAAAWMHGEAARRLGPGLSADDLVEKLPDVLNDLAPAALRRSV